MKELCHCCTRSLHQATVQRLSAENSEICEKLAESEKGPKIELPAGISEEEIKTELTNRLKPEIESKLKLDLEPSLRQSLEAEIRAEIAPKLASEIRSDLEENVLVALEEELRLKIEEELRGQKGSTEFTSENLSAIPTSSAQTTDFENKISDLEQELEAAKQLEENSSQKIKNLTEDLESAQSQATILLQQLNEFQELQQKNIKEKNDLEAKIRELENVQNSDPKIPTVNEPVEHQNNEIDRSEEINELLSKLSLATRTIEEQKAISENTTKDFEARLNELTSKLFQSEAREVQLTDKITDQDTQIEKLRAEISKSGRESF